MIHPHTELRFINESIGYGVFATEFIPKGTIVWILDDLDQKFDEDYLNSLDPLRRDRLLTYCFRDEQGQYILCWDIARYVNHSFHSTLIPTPYKFELAAKDIAPGEEITDDYGYFNLDYPFHCLPELNTSRTKVMPDDLLFYYPEWDQKAAEAMKYFNQVDQPLMYLLDPAYAGKVRAIADGKEPMDSLLTCYYDRSQNLKAV